jgi:hypothetical protein
MPDEKPDVAQIKLLEIAKHARRLKFDLRSAYQSADDMALILTPLCAEPGTFNKWLEKLRLISTQGVIGLRECNPAQAKALRLDPVSCPDVDILNDHEPWLISSVRRDFFATSLQQFNLTLNALDALTRVGGFALNEDYERGSDSFELYNPDVFISWHGRGTKAILKGAIKFGKTNTALWMAQRFIEKGVDVFSNIMVTNPPPGYYYCPTLSSLLIQVCDANIKKHEVNIIFDESNLFWAKVDTVHRKNVDLSKLALCFGKFHASLLFVSHYTMLVPTVVAMSAVAEFEKMSLKTLYADIRQGKVLHSRTVKEWPATSLLYDPDQLQWFSLDVDVDGLFSFMTNLKEGESQWVQVKKYVRDHAGEIEDVDVDPRTFAEWLKRSGRSVAEIAKILDRNERTVRRWLDDLGE